MYRITKGDLTVTADTEAEMRVAVAVLCEQPDPPSWRVGGPKDGER